MRTVRTFTPGDRVKYSARWLRSCGFLTGPIPFATGTVTMTVGFNGGQLCSVEWDATSGLPRLSQVLAANLTPAGKPELD